MAQINFESKQRGIPEDKKFMKFVARCFDAMEKSFLELLEAVGNKNSQIQKLPLVSEVAEKPSKKEQETCLSNQKKTEPGKKRKN